MQGSHCIRLVPTYKFKSVDTSNDADFKLSAADTFLITAGSLIFFTSLTVANFEVV
jgi:hypothetical protein